MTDALMTQIAKEYMQKMGITNTQYLLVRHLDQPHPHCHLVYNQVGNNGQTISDKNIKIRNAKVCRELTEKYGLYLAPGKDDTGCMFFRCFHDKWVVSIFSDQRDFTPASG